MNHLPPSLSRLRLRRLLGPAATVVVVLAILLVVAAQWVPNLHPRHETPGPPWVYGAPTARFTIVEYADLECPYCRVYFPALRAWVDAHHDVNWQWHHLPLAMHAPAAAQEAHLAECAGRLGGQAGFWTAVTWIYGNTRLNGEGIPADRHYPDDRPALRACLADTHIDGVIRQQSDEAQRDQIEGTPTLRLIDHRTGQSLIIRGAADGDTLLSAIDQLISFGTQARSSGMAQTTTTGR